MFFARIESSKSSGEKFFLLAQNVNVPHFPTSKRPLILATNTSTELGSGSSGIDCHQEVCPKKVKLTDIGTGLSGVDCHLQVRPKEVADNARRQIPAAVKGMRCIPLVIDPFRKRDLQNPILMKEKQDLWHPHWKGCLAHWLCTYVPWRHNDHCDKYWFPPNTINSNVSVRIRSGPDLASFLDYCSARQTDFVQPTETIPSLDYQTLLLQWGLSRKLGGSREY